MIRRAKQAEIYGAGEAARNAAIQLEIRRALEITRGHVGEAARVLGLARSRLYRLSKDVGFDLSGEAKKLRK